MLKKLIPAFSLSFDAPVWRIEASPSATRLFLELRDADRHQVQFAALELPSGRLLWKDLGLDDPWWATLAAASEQYLLLQSFTDTHNPEKKTYVAVEVASRQTVWQSDHFQMVSLEGDQVFGYNVTGESRVFVQLTLPEGTMREADPTQKKPKGKNKDFYQPFFYSENQPYFTTVADFVESLAAARPVGGCEYLEYGACVCVAYYVPNDVANEVSREEAGLANYLLIIDQDGTILLHECLEVSVPKAGLGTFFIAQDQLVVVQHKLQLVGYALS